MIQFNTFWEIISNQGIEIPPIQRDYAQGRESEKIDKIRKNFINSISTALKENAPLRLDFIYGKIYGIRNEEEHRRNKNAINSLLRSVKDYATSIDLTFNEIEINDKSPNKEDLVYLIPLDGQQRLTTLFIFHWYFSKRLNIIENLTILKRFKYKTRKSSLSFINLLCSEFDIDFKKPIDEEIKGLENFSNTWLDDPTVKSILVVLKAVHKEFVSDSDKDIVLYLERITTGKIIFFDFLNLIDFNLSDELYVKMNARGKQLTDFENFKAWLFGEIENKQLFNDEMWKEYKSHFDIKWNDIFWNVKKSGEYEIDTAYLNFFKLLFIYDLIKRVPLDKTNFKKSNCLTRIDIIQRNKLMDFEKDFDDLFFENIQKYLKVLDVCSNYKPEETILEDFYKFYFSKVGLEPKWNNITKHYILLSYLTTKSKKLEEYSKKEINDLEEYFRILNNLFRNTIIDNPSLYKKAINEIDEITNFLKNNDFDISIWIESIEYNLKSVFQKYQFEEEILKYRLLNQDNEWKELIFEAESIPYFEGQLNFWFYITNIELNKDKYTKDYSQETYKTHFKSITNRILLMFNKDGVNRSKHFSERIFERALLSKADYLMDERKYSCFCRNTGRDVSWKRLFLRDRNSEETNIALKEIFALNFDNVKTSLTSYIEKNKEIYTGDNWRKVLIENKELFKYIGNQKYIRNINNHGWVIIKDNYKTYIGPHYELFSLDLYIKHILNKLNDYSPFNESKYYPAAKNNLDDIPCAVLDWKTDNFIYAIDISYLNNQYNLRFFSRNIAIKEIIKITLSNLEFEESGEDYIQKIKSEHETIEMIHKVCDELKKISNE